MKLIVLLVFYKQLKQSEEKTFSVAFLKEKKAHHLLLSYMQGMKTLLPTFTEKVNHDQGIKSLPFNF